MTKFKFKGQIKEIMIIPWEPGQLGISCIMENGTRVAQVVDFHENCFFNKKSTQPFDAPDDSAAHRDWKHDIYKQCDREDAEQCDAFDSEGQPVLENVTYFINRIDADHLSLHRSD